MKYIIIIPLVLLQYLANAQEIKFISNDWFILGATKDKSASISAGDIDNDGDKDVIVANGRHWPQPNQVFFNNGDGFFTVSRIHRNLFHNAQYQPVKGKSRCTAGW